MSLTARDERLVELMDDPACDPVALRRTLRRFRLLNPLVSGWGGVYRTQVRPALAAVGGPARILDIGCGGGDVLRQVVRMARRDGFVVTGTGVDPDERAIEVARDAEPLVDVDYRAVGSAALVRAGDRFDVVISNHVLHHLPSDVLSAFLDESAALAERLVVHSDIARSRSAYAAYAVGITPLAPGSFLRTDGLRSIRRSYRPAELAAALPSGWVVERARPFRLLAVRRDDGASSAPSVPDGERAR